MIPWYVRQRDCRGNEQDDSERSTCTFCIRICHGKGSIGLSGSTEKADALASPALAVSADAYNGVETNFLEIRRYASDPTSLPFGHWYKSAEVFVS